MRSFLRQDPNIVLVGEIRDFETAEIAIKAALTGHLVLSTLHTNDAPSTVSRMVNMGIEPFLVATSVNLIQAQRLIRRVCSNCKEAQEIPVEALVETGFSEDEAGELTMYKGAGCDTCNGTGYKGRVGLFEVMEMNDELRELVIIGASSIEIRKKAIELGMVTLRESGLCKLREGITTIEEVVKGNGSLVWRFYVSRNCIEFDLCCRAWRDDPCRYELFGSEVGIRPACSNKEKEAKTLLAKSESVTEEARKKVRRKKGSTPDV